MSRHMIIFPSSSMGKGENTAKVEVVLKNLEVLKPETILYSNIFTRFSGHFFDPIAHLLKNYPLTLVEQLQYDNSLEYANYVLARLDCQNNEYYLVTHWFQIPRIYLFTLILGQKMRFIASYPKFSAKLIINIVGEIFKLPILTGTLIGQKINQKLKNSFSKLRT